MAVQRLSDRDLRSRAMHNHPATAVAPDDLGPVERHMEREGIDTVAPGTRRTSVEPLARMLGQLAP